MLGPKRRQPFRSRDVVRYLRARLDVRLARSHLRRCAEALAFARPSIALPFWPAPAVEPNRYGGCDRLSGESPKHFPRGRDGTLSEQLDCYFADGFKSNATETSHLYS